MYLGRGHTEAVSESSDPGRNKQCKRTRLKGRDGVTTCLVPRTPRSSPSVAPIPGTPTVYQPVPLSKDALHPNPPTPSTL